MTKPGLVMRLMLTAAAFAVAGNATAQSPAEFYKGKDVKILVGAGVGGTYGLYALLASRHMRKYIPGEPNLVLQSMPGAGGINAMNFSYNVAPRDGTLLHLVHAEVLFETLLTANVKFNAQKYQWIGRLADADFVGLVSKRSGVGSLQDAKSREVTFGATGVRSVTAIGPWLFNRTAATKFKVIAGYKGTSDIFIAMDRGEVDGVAVSWANALSIHGAKMDKGDLIPIFAVAEERMQQLPKVPSITEFGRDDNEKTFLSLYTSSGTIGRSLVFPPGVPQDRVDAMRAAFDRMLGDSEFQAEVKARKILYAPMSGEQLARYVDKHMVTSPVRIEAARKIYGELLENKK